MIVLLNKGLRFAGEDHGVDDVDDAVAGFDVSDDDGARVFGIMTSRLK
jgi:hypothetical protein